MSDTDTCPFCNSNACDYHFKKDGRLLKCTQCGITFLEKKLWATEEEPNYYKNAQNYISAMHDPFRVKISRDRALSLIARICHYFQNKHETKWLDVGANNGLLVEELLNASYNAEGLELNESLVALAQSRKLPVRQCDITNLSRTRPSEYDVISAVDVFEHLPQPIKFLESMKNLIKNNGLLVLEIPNIESFLARHHKMQWRYVDREHLHYFSQKTLRNLLMKYGFTIERVYTTNPFLVTMSMKKLLHYYVPRSIDGDRLQRALKGVTVPVDYHDVKKTLHFTALRSLIKKLLIAGIHLLHREDFILVIARNNK